MNVYLVLVYTRLGEMGNRMGDITTLFRLLILAKASFSRIALHCTELRASFAKAKRGSLDIRNIPPSKIAPKGLFYLAEDGRFELPLQVSPH